VDRHPPGWPRTDMQNAGAKKRQRFSFLAFNVKNVLEHRMPGVRWAWPLGRSLADRSGIPATCAGTPPVH
jgi:hypothetical protein